MTRNTDTKAKICRKREVGESKYNRVTYCPVYFLLLILTHRTGLFMYVSRYVLRVKFAFVNCGFQTSYKVFKMKIYTVFIVFGNFCIDSNPDFKAISRRFNILTQIHLLFWIFCIKFVLENQIFVI